MTNHHTPLPSPDSQEAPVYDWVPVARRPRRDGWSPVLQQLFITTLADTASVAQAAKAVGKTRQSAYAFRRTPAGAAFGRAWDSAIAEAANYLLDIAFDRCVNGVQRPVKDRHGNQIDVRTTYSNSLLMSLIRAHHPRLGRDAAKDAGVMPLDEALAALMPDEPEHGGAEELGQMQAMVDDPERYRQMCDELAANSAIAEAAWGERDGDDPTPGTVAPPVTTTREQAEGMRLLADASGKPYGDGEPFDMGDHSYLRDELARKLAAGDTGADFDEGDYRHYSAAPATTAPATTAPAAPPAEPAVPRETAATAPRRIPGKREMAQRKKALARATRGSCGGGGAINQVSR